MDGSEWNGESGDGRSEAAVVVATALVATEMLQLCLLFRRVQCA